LNAFGAEYEDTGVDHAWTAAEIGFGL
jgi:hypothetical protein